MMNLDNDLIKNLTSLGFRSSPDALRALFAQATKARLSPIQSYEKLISLEFKEREVKNLVSRTKAATLGRFKPLDKFEWSHPTAIDHDLFDVLMTLSFIDEGHNVLFRGPAGVGKSMLSQNLGLLALQQGFTVKFVTLAAALADLLKKETLPALERRMHRYLSPDLLILDELGFVPCDNRSADLLFNLISRRHELRSTIITTNLSFKNWGTVFPGAACVTALIDRFVQHCFVMDIEGESYREKESRQFTAAQREKKGHSLRKRNKSQ